MAKKQKLHKLEYLTVEHQYVTGIRKDGTEVTVARSPLDGKVYECRFVPWNGKMGVKLSENIIGWKLAGV